MSVFRSQTESVQIPITDLVVGDIFRISVGMMIPADSILLSIGHQYDDEDLHKVKN